MPVWPPRHYGHRQQRWPLAPDGALGRAPQTASFDCPEQRHIFLIALRPLDCGREHAPELQTKLIYAKGPDLFHGLFLRFNIFLILTLFYTNIYSNYLRMPWLVALPLLAVFGLACIPRLLNAFCLAIFGIEMSEFQCRHQYVQKVLTFAKTSKLLSGFRKNFMQILKAVFGEHSPATIQQGGFP